MSSIFALIREVAELNSTSPQNVMIPSTFRAMEDSISGPYTAALKFFRLSDASGTRQSTDTLRAFNFSTAA